MLEDSYWQIPLVPMRVQMGPGDFPLADGSLYEPAIYFEGAPGSFTAIVSGVAGTAGVGLIEIYAVD